ncbi:PIN domain-containing protein [Candidatus Thiothrix sp. Deng01]|uniref:PIN domain-containing protein n=1 Tax=Candidatus Thiothrix phosphatis TaxID=3112415 RepID=A0ABU6CYW5_9GAMM|nr:PIN domain-containing protein [Candidatus Thiothrix sp. Deng01]MEB4591578.1 PIN domain-containing protein [Candidatus Thiothrix sp. Deng01]
MSRRIFVDANIINDIYDQKRRFHEASYQCLEYCLKHDVALVTSCDIVTTVYYITTKSQDAQKALEALAQVNDIFEIAPFDNALLAEAIQLMQQDADYVDLEDTLQFVMARQAGCDLILTNDGSFVAKGLQTVSSPDFIRQKTVG